MLYHVPICSSRGFQSEQEHGFVGGSVGPKTRTFLDALPIGTARLCAFLPRTSVFRGVGVGRVGVGLITFPGISHVATLAHVVKLRRWGGVWWGGANNVPWYLTCCYACTCG